MDPLELNLSGVIRAKRKSAFLRQFLPPTTRLQLVFDVLFGIVAPVACFAFDPLVFKTFGFGEGLVPQYQVFTYLVSAIEIGTLIVFLVSKNQLPSSRLIGA